MPSKGIIDDAQMVDIEYGDCEPWQALRPPREQAAEALAEQGALGEAGERLEVGKEPHRILLVEVLQTEGQVGGELLEQQHLIRANETGRERATEKGPDRGIVHAQREAGERAHARGDELAAFMNYVGEAFDVFTQCRLPGANDGRPQASL